MAASWPRTASRTHSHMLCELVISLINLPQKGLQFANTLGFMAGHHSDTDLCGLAAGGKLVMNWQCTKIPAQIQSLTV